ncbi:MAG: VanZ family protein [Patescibacteria group bacterium]
MDSKETISRKVIKYWLPVFAWSLVIFFFSSLPTAPVSKVYWREFVTKKSAHIFEYGVFGTLMYRALKESGVKKREAGVYSIILAILYGISDEFHQSFTPGRDSRIRDVFFDTIGATLAIYLIWKLLPKAPKKLKIWAERLQLI